MAGFNPFALQQPSFDVGSAQLPQGGGGFGPLGGGQFQGGVDPFDLEEEELGLQGRALGVGQGDFFNPSVGNANIDLGQSAPQAQSSQALGNAGTFAEESFAPPPVAGAAQQKPGSLNSKLLLANTIAQTAGMGANILDRIFFPRKRSRNI